jgi:hypothetical protein
MAVTHALRSATVGAATAIALFFPFSSKIIAKRNKPVASAVFDQICEYANDEKIDLPVLSSIVGRSELFNVDTSYDSSSLATNVGADSSIALSILVKWMI